MGTKINLRLSSLSYNKFNQVATKAGVPKSKLLRKWLRNCNFSDLNLQRTISSGYKEYSLILDNTLLDKLNQLTSQFSLSRNAFVELLILNKTNKSGNQKSQIRKSAKNSELKINKSKLEDYWRRGDLKTIIQSTSYNLEQQPLQNAFLRSKAACLIGDFKNSYASLDFLEENSFNADFQTKSLLIQCDLALLADRDLEKGLKIGQKALKLAKIHSSRRTIAEILNTMALIYFYKDDLKKAIEFHFKCLEYVDKRNHPDLIIDTYNSLSIINYKTDQITLSIFYQRQAEKVLKDFHNTFFASFFYSRKCIYNYLENKFIDANYDIEKTFRLNKLNNSASQMVTYFEEKGKIHLYRNHLNHAYKFFEKADDLEDDYRPHVSIHRSKMYKAFIESISKFKYGMRTFKNAVKSQINRSESSYEIQPNLKEYLYNSMKFINSRDKSTNKSGLLGLKKLSQEGEYALIRRTAKKTLETKRLQPIW